MPTNCWWTLSRRILAPQGFPHIFHNFSDVGGKKSIEFCITSALLVLFWHLFVLLWVILLFENEVWSWSFWFSLSILPVNSRPGLSIYWLEINKYPSPRSSLFLFVSNSNSSKVNTQTPNSFPFPFPSYPFLVFVTLGKKYTWWSEILLLALTESIRGPFIQPLTLFKFGTGPWSINFFVVLK